mgnify:CR=1 FL=1
MDQLVFKIFKKAAYTLRGRHLNRFNFVRSSLNFLLRNLKPKSVIVDGNRVILDKDDSMRLSILGIYEPLMVKHFQERIKPGDTVLDIGAHIGYYTVMAAKRVGGKGHVYAFEPNKDNCVLLSKNIKINGYKNVVLINKAIAQSTKKAKLFLSSVSSGMHSLIDIDNDAEFSTLVYTVSLDDFFGKNPPRVSVIKMDIEGGEYSALEGMTTLLAKSKHLTIFTEFSPFAITSAKKSPLGFLNLLKHYGFKLYSIDELHKLLMPIKIKTFLASAPLDRDWHINLLAVK